MAKLSVPGLEALEPRLPPAGLVAASVSPAGVLTLGTVPGQDGDEVVTVSRTAGGTYILTPGAGVALRVRGIDHTTPWPMDGVTGGLVARLGAGNDQLTLDEGPFPRSVAIDLGAGNNTLTVQDATIAGGLAVTAGAGNDTVTFTGLAAAVGGAFTAQLGDGTNLVQAASSRATFGSFRVTGGAGNDTLQLTQPGLKFTTLVGGLTFNGGGGFGEDAVLMEEATAEVAITGPVRITGRGATEVVSIRGSQFHAGSLQLAFGDGVHFLDEQSAEFDLAGGLRWASGSGHDLLHLSGDRVRIGGGVAVAAGDGIGSVRLTPSALLSVGRGIAIRNGATTMESNIIIEAPDTVIGGPVTLAAGAGDTDISLEGANRLAVGGSVAVAHGAGPGTMLVGGSDVFSIAGSISLTRVGGLGFSHVFGPSGEAVVAGPVTMVGGADQTLILTGVVGGVTMTGAPGAATSMTVMTAGLGRLNVRDPVRLTSRSAAGQTASVRLVGVIAEGPLVVLGGAGEETLRIDDCAFLRSVTADLGAGSDRFDLEQNGLFAGSSAFNGPVLLRGGADNDTFRIGGDAAANTVFFRAAATADGGAGTDALTVGSQVAFDPEHPLASLNIP
jgi:fibronectin-binding autotransporter adhesin